METLDWGFCPELTFIKAHAAYVALEQADPNLAVCFAKFIQKAYKPTGNEAGIAWKVPDVPDGAVFWYELLKAVPAVVPVKQALVAAIGQLPNGAALRLALNQL
jgi:hypothetical protein